MKKLLLITTAVCLFTFNHVNSQTIKEKTALEGTQNEALKALSLAKSNAVMGYGMQNPILLIAAAQILIENPVSDVQLVSSNTPEFTPTDDESKISITLDPTKLLDDARIFAMGNQNAMALIENLKGTISSTSRGTVSGPYTLERYVDKRMMNEYTINFVGEQLAEILVVGDGDTDLDLYVYDSNNNEIDSDTDYTDRCYVSWVPKWTGPFKVIIVNRGGVYNKFTLFTN